MEKNIFEKRKAEIEELERIYNIKKLKNSNLQELKRLQHEIKYKKFLNKREYIFTRTSPQERYDIIGKICSNANKEFKKHDYTEIALFYNFKKGYYLVPTMEIEKIKYENENLIDSIKSNGDYTIDKIKENEEHYLGIFAFYRADGKVLESSLVDTFFMKK